VGNPMSKRLDHEIRKNAKTAKENIYFFRGFRVISWISRSNVLALVDVRQPTCYNR